MIELVFVIVVIGIITSVMLPRFDRDNVYEAAQQVISHIKYTQHLAMIDNKYDDADPNWFLERWQIQFYNCGGYVIFSDTNQLGGPDRSESAVEPLSRKRLFTTNTCTESPQDFDKIVLSNNYDITSVTFGAGCGGNQYIMFDHLGRPYSARTVNGVLTNNCDITLTSGSGSGAVIRVVPETGYAYLLNYF